MGVVCPDCGYDFDQESPMNTDDVCPVCGWSDDDEPDDPNAPNEEDIEGVDDGVWQ